MKREALAWLELHTGCSVAAVAPCVVPPSVPGLVSPVTAPGSLAFLACGGTRTEFRLGWIASSEKKNKNENFRLQLLFHSDA